VRQVPLHLLRPHPPKNSTQLHAKVFFSEKAAVRTDAAPTNKRSAPKTRTSQTLPIQESSPPWLTSKHLNSVQAACHFPALLLLQLNSSPPKVCIRHSTFLPSKSHTLHCSPRTRFPLPPSLITPKELSSFSHPIRMAEGSQPQLHTKFQRVLWLLLFLAPSALSPLCLSPKTKTAQSKPCRSPHPAICSPLLPLNSYSNESTHPPSSPQSPARRHSSSPKFSSS
jgi:hypothetical protein